MMISHLVQQIFSYHDQTKHHLHRYARSAGYLDWSNQPHAFRFYEHVTPVLLPLLKKDPEGCHADLYERGRSIFWDFSVESIAGFLELSMGLSAWKSAGNARWALRMNPSSGNLHPTEAHLILPSVKGLDAGVYHYSPYSHALEPRAVLPPSFVQRMRSHWQSDGFLIALTSIHWREAWKYGERAYRYCQHDVGHALAALSIAGNLFGWKVTYLNGVPDIDMGTLLGLRKVEWVPGEEETGDLACFVSPASRTAIGRSVPPDLINGFSQLAFSGKPKPLSPTRLDWEIIPAVSEAARKPRGEEQTIRFPTWTLSSGPTSTFKAASLIRQRRSAVAFDASTSVSRSQFIAMLARTLPQNRKAPFDVEVGSPLVHLFIFVHRVTGVEPGLYALVRNPEHQSLLQKAASKKFLWESVESSFPLYLLQKGSFTQQARDISCHQPIAGDSAFSLGMVARFRPTIDQEPWLYRALFWETGMIGQILYLEAEAAGVRGTGIGCFFDDAMHDVLGFKSDAFQSLYHFTVGGPVEDIRLTTEAPYAHLPLDRQVK